ncbi:FAD-binding oxidoreductase [Hyphomicrobium sp.]|uniref:NAD(P)/FAD-dependent oxidoreductase n=1 Tax=Hyphomicrobium sp. TaxID=82 RepID=UPI0025BE8840|nr:FAD-binding oxidoreductase [Hyphomicrobium sp.]MCC7251826.1 FAD-binding oxidoreductase [Hyphomicrobium sp.]
MAIVGAGVSGALVAARLADDGHDVVMIDRRPLLTGSTRASTAMIQFELDTPLTKLSDQIGAKAAARAYLRSYRAVQSLKQVIKRHGISCGWRDRHALYLAGNEMGWRGLEGEARQRAKLGLPSEFLAQGPLRDRFGIDRTGATWSEGAAELNPVQLAAGCLRAARRLGARIYAPHEIKKVDATGRGVDLTTSEGAVVSARRAIFATGYEVVDPIPKGAFEITSSWAIATKPLDPTALWPSRCLIWEAADPYLYIRTTPDNRIVAGGEDSGLTDPDRRDSATTNKAMQILAKVERLLPGRKLELDYAWAGAFAESSTGLAHIAPIDGWPACLAVLACGGNGITFSQIAAELASRWVRGREDPDADLFR